MKNIADQVVGWFRRTETQVPTQPSAAEDASLRQASLSIAPVLWLLGKTGSGKTSIVAAMTGADHAEIGNGYQSCTRTTGVYDFPVDQPLVRFLDTRGLGEAGYDPTEDMAVNAERAHLILAVMRVSDQNQKELVSALLNARAAHPDWPILVVQTGLHDLYEPADSDHPSPYPFASDLPAEGASSIPRALRSALRHQHDLLNKLPGIAPRFVQIDFTRPEDGYTPAAYGREALIDAVIHVAPDAMKSIAKAYLIDAHQGAMAGMAEGAHTTILYYAAAAAGVGAVPVVGLGTVPAAQAAMLWALARRYEVEWDWASTGSLMGMLGTAAVARQAAMLALRQFAKAMPWTIPVAATQDYAVTYALGRATCVFLAARRNRTELDAEAIKESFRNGLVQAFGFLRKENPK